MGLVIRMRPIKGGEPVQVALSDQYTLTDVEQELNYAIHDGFKISLMLGDGVTEFEFDPAEYRSISLADDSIGDE